ncbi:MULTISPECIES: N-acetylglucosamine kinase [Bacillus]|uniref:N-acetylglucosamine kinase n=1 Tax=Bacillus TaxID=1386 RepID=UPI00030C5E2D|nr:MULTISPECIES: BadF/BadG/BcrA/BcrD ATPase family protein [Bacillus]
MKQKMYPLLAIDGGGTKTLAVLTDCTGKIIGRGKAGASNYHGVGEERAKQSLQVAIEEAINNTEMNEWDNRRIERAVFAIAGIDTERDEGIAKTIVEEALKNLSIEVETLYVENDCLSAMLGATGQCPGGLMIAGTGSIVYAHDGKGHIVRVGGWGHLLGDEGSGYWIGMQAIQIAMRMHDGREQKSELYTLLLRHFDFDSAEELCDWMYSSHFSVKKVANLAVIVHKAALSGDKISEKILLQASEQLAELLITGLSKLQIVNCQWRIILQGGILQNNDFVQQKVIQLIQKEIVHVEFSFVKEEPISYIIRRGLM